MSAEYSFLTTWHVEGNPVTSFVFSQDTPVAFPTPISDVEGDVRVAQDIARIVVASPSRSFTKHLL